MEKQTPKNNLKKLRIEKGFSQKEFYEDIIKKELGLDITLRTYQNWENPNNEIKSKPALLLAEYFRVNVGYLLGDDERRTDYLSSTIDKYSDNMNSPADFAGYGLLALTRGEKVRDTVIENLREITDYYGHRRFAKEEFKNWSQEKKDFMIKEMQDYADTNIGRFLAGLMTFPDKTKITIIDFLSLDKSDREALSTIISSLADNPVLHKDYDD
jgi:phage transcriptional regulator, cro/CI family